MDNKRPSKNTIGPTSGASNHSQTMKTKVIKTVKQSSNIVKQSRDAVQNNKIIRAGSSAVNTMKSQMPKSAGKISAETSKTSAVTKKKTSNMNTTQKKTPKKPSVISNASKSTGKRHSVSKKTGVKHSEQSLPSSDIIKTHQASSSVTSITNNPLTAKDSKTLELMAKLETLALSEDSLKGKGNNDKSPKVDRIHQINVVESRNARKKKLIEMIQVKKVEIQAAKLKIKEAEAEEKQLRASLLKLDNV